MPKLFTSFATSREWAEYIKTYENFRRTLPQRIQEIWDWEVRQIWLRAKRKAQVAINIEERRSELEAINSALESELQEKGFTFDDIEAIRRVLRENPTFGYQVADHTLPPAYRAVKTE